MNDSIVFIHECISSGCDVAPTGSSNAGQFAAVSPAGRRARVGRLGHVRCDLAKDSAREKLLELLDSPTIDSVVREGGVVFIDNVRDCGTEVQPIPADVEAALRSISERPDRSPKFSIVVNSPVEGLSEGRLSWLSRAAWGRATPKNTGENGGFGGGVS